MSDRRVVRIPRGVRRRHVLTLLLVVGVALGACTSSPAGAPCPDDLAGVRPGGCPLPQADRLPAPTDDFDLLGSDETVSLADFAGEVVVVNFWASWCGPCRREQPELNLLVDEYADQPVAFVGVNVQDDSDANALLHVDEFDIPYPSIHDPSTMVASTFEGVGPETLPATILLDRQGRVAVSLFGETTAIELSQLIDLLLDE